MRSFYEVNEEKAIHLSSHMFHQQNNSKLSTCFSIAIYYTSGWCGQVQKISPQLEFNPRTIQAVVNCYTNYTILPT